MPMVMENLVIAKHWDILWYAIICGGCYQPHIHKFELRVTYIYIFVTDNNDYFECDCMTCNSSCVEDFTFWNAIVEGWNGQTWKDQYAIVHHVIFPMWIKNQPIFSGDSCRLIMYVMWAFFKSCHYVYLWSVFSKLAYGMSYATFVKGAN
jgi:hypothetical protein